MRMLMDKSGFNVNAVRSGSILSVRLKMDTKILLNYQDKRTLVSSTFAYHVGIRRITLLRSKILVRKLVSSKIVKHLKDPKTSKMMTPWTLILFFNNLLLMNHLPKRSYSQFKSKQIWLSNNQTIKQRKVNSFLLLNLSQRKESLHLQPKFLSPFARKNWP